MSKRKRFRRRWAHVGRKRTRSVKLRPVRSIYGARCILGSGPLFEAYVRWMRDWPAAWSKLLLDGDVVHP